MILKYNNSEFNDHFIYLMCSMDDSVDHILNLNSNNFIENTKDQISYGGINYYRNEVIDGYDVKSDIIEIIQNKYKLLDQTLDIGDSISLEVSANSKMKYYSAVNRELNNDADDDEEAIIYTHDTLDAISNISINDKFLSYSCEIEPLLNQAYYNEGNSLTKYFHVIGTDEYKGFYINNFNGRWITANGQYFRSYRKNKKNSYIHESGNWLVFYSITKPNCKKTEIKGAWVLLKIDSRNFAEKEESELFADKFYGCTDLRSLNLMEM